MTTTSLALLDIVVDAIGGAGTDAEDRVFSPGDWPTQDTQYPVVKLRLIAEDRQSLGRSTAPEFTTTALIRIAGEVSEPASMDDAGAIGAETAMWRLKRQIEVAIVNYFPLMSRLQNIPQMRSQLAFSSDGAQHLAGVQIDLSLEFYEGPESFHPVDADDLQRVDVTNTAYPPTGVTVDNLDQ